MNHTQAVRATVMGPDARIPDAILENVGYLYRSIDAANSGEEFGGTAFLVAIKSRHEGKGYLYAVSNHHVAVERGFSCIRLNTQDGKTETFEFDPSEWVFSNKYDLAAVNLPADRNIHRFKILCFEELLTEEEAIEGRIGVGDDVFMVGRFVDHDGGQINRPAVRFGNISVMPAPIEQPNKQMAPAYCIDLHSRSGYSGSPVFIYRTAGWDLSEVAPSEFGPDTQLVVAGTHYLNLLGIHFSQFPEIWELSEEGEAPKAEGNVPLIKSGKYVKGLSGMTCVLPSWIIKKFLSRDDILGNCRRADDEIAEYLAKNT